MVENIDQILHISKAYRDNWSGEDMIVPDGMLVFNTITKTLQYGTGELFIEDLPTWLNLEDLYNASFGMDNSLPNTSDSSIRQILVLGEQYCYLSEVDVDNYLNVNELVETLSSYADVAHTHLLSDIDGIGTVAGVSAGLGIGQVPIIASNGLLPKEIIPPNIGLNDKDSDIMSYLILSNMERDNKQATYLRYGFVDEFTDLSGIDIINSRGYLWYDTPTHCLIKVDNDCVIVSKQYDIPIMHNRMYVFLRGNLIQGKLNQDIIFEVSKNGNVWTPAILEKSPLMRGSIECYSAYIDIKDRRDTRTIVDAIIQDDKGYTTTFHVDTINTSGHVDIPLSTNITPGYCIHTEEHVVVITNIIGDGTEVDSISFSGILPYSGVYENIMISGIYKDENGYTLSGKWNDVTEEYTVVQSPMTLSYDLTQYHYKTIFDMYLNNTITDTMDIFAIYGYQNDFYIYDTEYNNYIKIVRYYNNNYQYFDISTNNWIVNSNGSLESTISKAYQVNDYQYNHIDDLTTLNALREGMVFDRICIVMRATNITTSTREYIESLHIDSIVNTTDIPEGSSLRWRMRYLNDSDFTIHGIRLRC